MDPKEDQQIASQDNEMDHSLGENPNQGAESQNENDKDNSVEQSVDQGSKKDDEIVQTDEVDRRSVFVKNVDYGSKKDEIIEHFKACGKINRVTIIYDKFTQHPKGCCYIEFSDKDSAENAMALSHSIFRGRQIKIYPKRTNVPNRGRGGGAAAGGAPSFRGRRSRGRYGFLGSYASRSRGSFYRGRGRVFMPYMGGGGGRRGGFNPY